MYVLAVQVEIDRNLAAAASWLDNDRHDRHFSTEVSDRISRSFGGRISISIL